MPEMPIGHFFGWAVEPFAQGYTDAAFPIQLSGNDTASNHTHPKHTQKLKKHLTLSTHSYNNHFQSKVSAP